MSRIARFVQNLQTKFFESVVSNNLIYNTCWEDPRIDRELLQLDSKSKIVILTSAGCNALDYLLDDPKSIHCVDVNPAQNSLLELKRALFKNKNYQLLWHFFGNGKQQAADFVYRRKLRDLLKKVHRPYWDAHIHFFTPSFSEPSFYFRGTSGRFALMVYRNLQRKGLYQQILNLLNAQSLQEQRYYFEEIEPQLLSVFEEWLISRQATMTLLGVPSAQRKMIKDHYEGGLLSFIQDALQKVFTTLPVYDNYFWRVYITGSYHKSCCPNYLLEDNFNFLSNRIDRLQSHSTSLLYFLKSNPGTYSHFVLLDHQDWLSDTHPGLLVEEWNELLKNSESGTRILFRSAASKIGFLPDFVGNHVEFTSTLTKQLHKKDRVGTYAGTHLGVVK